MRARRAVVASGVALALASALLAPTSAGAVASPTLLRAVCDNNNVAGRYWWCEPSDIGTNDDISGGLIRGLVDDGLTPHDRAGIVTDDEQVNAAFRLLGQVAGWYWSTLGVDLVNLIGFAPADGSKPRVLSATVNACMPQAGPCGDMNAYWLDSTELEGKYVGGAVSFTTGIARFKDVVAHEMTHGVIDALMPLRYAGESGAIDEGFADIFGELADRWSQDPDEVPGEDDLWLIGEGRAWSNGANFLRSIADPPVVTSQRRDPGQGASCQGQQPDRMTHPCWQASPETKEGDFGGVHTNSGVAAKAAYLMAAGGAFNGVIIPPAAADARTSDAITARVWFDVLRQRRMDATTPLPSISVQGRTLYTPGYFELGRALIHSCRTLVARKSIPSTTCDRTVIPALRATEIIGREVAYAIPATAPKGRSTTVSATVSTKGAAARPLAGQKVTLEKYDPRRRAWVPLTSGVTGASGRAAFGVKFTAATKVRIVVAGKDGLAPATSPARTVAVR